jgi:hypothetical protein
MNVKDTHIETSGLLPIGYEPTALPLSYEPTLSIIVAAP